MEPVEAKDVGLKLAACVAAYKAGAANWRQLFRDLLKALGPTLIQMLIDLLADEPTPGPTT